MDSSQEMKREIDLLSPHHVEFLKRRKILDGLVVNGCISVRKKCGQVWGMHQGGGGGGGGGHVDLGPFLLYLCFSK